MASCENKYTTLLDLSRQAKVITGETACFDGKIEAGIPFSGYPTGVDNSSSVSLGVVSSETAVFSGNTGTTVFDVSNTGSTNYNALFSGYSGTVWTNALFSGNTSGLTLPITTLSADTQIVGEDYVTIIPSPPFTALTTGPIWTLTQTATTSNGEHIIGIQYTGYTITYAFSQLEQLSVTAYTAYSGFSSASQENFSAGTLDYKGPLDYISTKEDATVDGILTTKKLTVTDGASASTIGYVLTQLDEDGRAGWVFNSASASTGGYWVSGSSGTNSIRVTNGGGTDATGDYAVATGFISTASGNYSNVGGFDNEASGEYSQAQGYRTVASGDYSHTEGKDNTSTGSTSHSEGLGTKAHGDNSHAEGAGSISTGTNSHAGGIDSESIGITSFIHSTNSIVTGNRSAILGGQNITGTTDDTVYVPNLIVPPSGGTVGIGTETPTESLHIYGGDILIENGSGKFYTDLTRAVGPLMILSGGTGDLVQISASIPGSEGMAIGSRGSTASAGTSGYGKQSDGWVYSSAAQNGLNIISQYGGVSKDDYIRFYAGKDADSTADMFISGTPLSTSYIGMGTETPTEKLHISGNIKIEGFTIMGDSSVGIKMKRLSGTTPAVATNGFINHSLTQSKIINWDIIVTGTDGIGYKPECTEDFASSTNSKYSTHIDSTNVYIIIPAGGTNVDLVPYEVTIWYIE